MKILFFLINISLIFNNYCINNDEIKQQCREALTKIENLEEIIKIRKEKAEIEYNNASNFPITGGGQGILKHKVSFYNYLLTNIVSTIKQDIELIKIKEEQFDNITLIALNNILSSTNYTDMTNVNYALRNITENFNEIKAELYIKYYTNMLMIHIEKSNTIEWVKKQFIELVNQLFDEKLEKTSNIFDEKLEKTLDQLDEKIKPHLDKFYKEIENLKSKEEKITEYLEKIPKYLDTKEKNIENILYKSIMSIKKISCCIICGLFSYNCYNRLIRKYNNYINSKTTKFSFIKKVKNNISNVFDIIVTILSLHYIKNTSKNIIDIWGKKD